MGSEMCIRDSRGARVRDLTIIRFMTVIFLRGLGPGRGRFRPRGARLLVRRGEIGKGLVEQGQEQKIQMEMSKEQSKRPVRTACRSDKVGA